MIKVALVGCGGMGGVHFDVYTRLTDVEVAALVDIRVEKALEKAQRRDINVYDNIDAMLEAEQIDVVDICTPSYLHKELTMKALAKGCHVLCEKPMALSSADAFAMAECAEKNNVYLMTAHVIRFWPEYRYLERIVRTGSMGQVHHAHFSRIGLKPRWSWENWMQDESKSGRVLFDLHIHDADFIFKLFGTPDKITPVKVDKGENICYWLNNYQYSDFFIIAEAAWYDCFYPFQMAYRVVFEKGIVEYKNGKLTVYPQDEEGKEIPMEEELLKELKLTVKNGYENEIRYFLDCVRKKTPPALITTEESVYCLRVLENIRI